MEIFIKPVLWTYRRITKGKKNLVEGEYGVRIRMTQARAKTYISISFSSSLGRFGDMLHPIPWQN
jgi:hypothetical protein